MMKNLLVSYKGIHEFLGKARRLGFNTNLVDLVSYCVCIIRRIVNDRPNRVPVISITSKTKHKQNSAFNEMLIPIGG